MPTGTQLSAEWSTIAGWIRELHEAVMPAEEIYDHVKGLDGSDLAQGAVECVVRNVNLFTKKDHRPGGPVTPEDVRVPNTFVGLGKVLERANQKEAHCWPGSSNPASAAAAAPPGRQ